MKGLQIHLENLVSRAQCHMRRDELWKRMLYGRPKSEGKPSSVSDNALWYRRVASFPGTYLFVHLNKAGGWE